MSPNGSTNGHASASNGSARYGVDVTEGRALVAELCRHFYDQGWVSGTGGGISVRADPDLIVMAPSGVQKERMSSEDMYVLSAKGDVVESPVVKPFPNKPPKLSECSPLFMSAYELRGAGAVLHSHAPETVMATLLREGAREFRCTQLEMIKGIKGHGFYDELVVPIIENTARECQLTDRLQAAMRAYPKTYAVLVRRHGVYVWGDNWIQAKTHAECYHYLFQIAARMSQMGVDPAYPALVPPADELDGAAAAAPPPAKRARVESTVAPDTKVVLLDIEGTTTPISFVKETLFPFATAFAKEWLTRNWGSAEAKACAAEIRRQCVDGGATGAAAVQVPPVPEDGEDPAASIEAASQAIKVFTAEDLKVPALKNLQGHVWRSGYEDGRLKAPVYEDVPVAMRAWTNAGKRVAIYSSGSRAAQRLLFKYSDRGDLRNYIAAYFDTKVGHKRSAASYREIALSLGVDRAAEVLFVTDIHEEAVAAKEAGMQVALSVRSEVVAPLPEAPVGQVIRSFEDLL